MKNILIIYLFVFPYLVGAQTLDTVSLDVYCYDGSINYQSELVDRDLLIPFPTLYFLNNDTANQVSGPYLHTSDGVVYGVINGGMHTNISNIQAPLYGYYVDTSNNDIRLVLAYYLEEIRIHAAPKICLVTSDLSTGYKQILIDTSYLDVEDSVILERQILSGWEVVDDNVSTTSITDSTFPEGQALTYRLRSATYGCLSSTVTTMNLSATLNIDPTKVDLIWTNYAPNDDLDGYYVIRVDGSSIDTIATVPLPNTTLTGVDWQAGQSFRIEAYKDVCQINPFNKSGRLAISSNKEDLSEYTTSIGLVGKDIKLKMLNPNSGLNIELSEPMDVKLYTTDGRLIKSYSRISRINDSELTNGLYFVVASKDDIVINRKLLVNQ